MARCPAPFIQGKPMRTSAHDVARFVATQYGRTFDDLCSKRMTRDFARPRQIAMYAIRDLCPHMSLPSIGRLLGGRDHTTVIHGVRKIEELIAVDRNIASGVTKVIRHFEQVQAEQAFEIDPLLIDHALHFRALCNGYGRAMGMAA